MTLMTHAEVTWLAHAEEVTTVHPRVACRGLAAVAAIWTPGPPASKQWRIVLAHAAEHRYRIAGFAQDAPAVVALATAAGAEVIVAAIEPRADREVLLAAPVRVELVDVETIARLLDLPLEHVRSALHGSSNAERQRRYRAAQRARAAPK